MTLFLTGSPTRFGEPSFTEDNGFLAEVKVALADDLCDFAFMARFKEKKEIQHFFDFVTKQ